ncbi:hypothetical protein ABFV38_18430 [Enterobacter cloacae complex sp. Mu1197]|uniref:Secreted protein n=1 Tax=Enterobacter cloacae complex sp. Mu1197 TaxID=3152302 RepID=A0AAU7FTG2_9ENTR
MNHFANIVKETIAIIALTLLCAFAAHATEHSDRRQAARDTRQDTRQSARDTKQNCVVNDDKSNGQCRQDKRQTKQDGRQKARDIKYF